MDQIAINLRGRELDDGRVYVDSPDLDGFHYLLEAGEAPEAMSETLVAFLGLYLKAEVKKLSRAQTPKAYRQTTVHAPDGRRRDMAFVAEVAHAA